MSYILRKSLPTNAWSVDEIRQLRQLVVAGASLESICVTLRRTRSAIKNKATMHGISLKRRGESLPSALQTQEHGIA
jgi:hypothetical protein